MNIKYKFTYLALSAALFFSCGQSGETESETTEETVDVPVSQSVCLWNNVSVRETAAADSKYLTALSIGEHVRFLDSVAVDESSSKKYEYVYIELSDGTKGWTRSDFIMRDITLSAVLRETKIYKRPDLLTASDKSFQPMDLVVVQERQNEWLSVKGKIKGGTWFTDGWIPESMITISENDLLTAQLVYKANEIEDGKKRSVELKNILNNPDLAQSYFHEDVQELVYSDPGNLLKKDLYALFECLVKLTVEDAWHFSTEGQKIAIRGKSFGTYLLNDNENGYHFLPWSLFWEFSNCAAQLKNYPLKTENYNYYDEDIRYNAIKDFSGIAVYTKTTQDNAPFNYVNKEFVAWVRDNLIPHPEDAFLGVPSQQIYNIVFKNNARDTWSQFVKLTSEYSLNELNVEYQSRMIEDEFNGVKYLQGRFAGSGVHPVLAGVWIRRAMDGSLDEIVTLMKKGMILYDKEWFEENSLTAFN